jgi:hypothetical protein
MGKKEKQMGKIALSQNTGLGGCRQHVYRWFLVARGGCLREPHSMRGRATMRDMSVFAGWFGLPNDESLLPCRSVSAEQPGGLDTKATAVITRKTTTTRERTNP